MLIVCEGCGHEFDPEKDFYNDVEVNVRDGSKRLIRLCDRTCCEFWDESAPGDWEVLDSGEEVQRRYWQCEFCDSVLEYGGVHLLVDTDDEEPGEYIVCVSCQRKEPGRFKTRAEVEGKA